MGRAAPYSSRLPVQGRCILHSGISRPNDHRRAASPSFGTYGYEVIFKLLCKSTSMKGGVLQPNFSPQVMRRGFSDGKAQELRCK